MDPDNRAFSTTWGLGITFSILAMLAVAARFACRPKRDKFFADDWFILPALLSALGSCIVVWWGYYNAGIGRIFPPGSPERQQPFIFNLYKAIYASCAVLIGSLTFAKISVLLFYRRIFTTPNFRVPFYTVLSLVTIWGIAYFVGFVVICASIRDSSPMPAASYAHTQFNESFAYTNVFLDLVVLSLPVPVVLKLQMSTRKKIGVLGVFMLGSIVLAISIAKTVAYYALFDRLSIDQDPTYDDASFVYWSIPESCLSVVAACLPTLTPLFKSRRLASFIGRMRDAMSLVPVRAPQAVANGPSPQERSPAASNGPSEAAISDRVPGRASRDAGGLEYELSTTVESGSRVSIPKDGSIISHNFPARRDS